MMFEVSFNILIIALLLLAAVFLFIPVRKDPGPGLQAGITTADKAFQFGRERHFSYIWVI